MSSEAQWDREFERLERDLADGFITQEQYKKSLTELRRWIREEQQDAAQDAYDNVMNNW